MMDREKEHKKKELERMFGAKRESKSNQGLPWKKILGITLLILIAVGIIWTWKPWETGGGVSETQQPEENRVPPEPEAIHVPPGKARFLYDAIFWYENSEHGKPLENVWIAFPVPHVDNNLSGVQCFNTAWTLNYIDSENIDRCEMLYYRPGDNLTINQLMGNRTTRLKIPQGPVIFSVEGCFMTHYQLSELYPREQFIIHDTILVNDENADDLTLEVAGENQRSMAIYTVAENKIIDLYFDVKLMGRIDDRYKTERFVGYYENVGAARFWLYPVQRE